MRVLVLAPDSPFPPIGGGQLRIYHLLRALAAQHDLTLVAFNWGAAAAAPSFPLRVVEVPWTMPPLYDQMLNGDEATARSAHNQLIAGTDEPFMVSYYHSPAMEETLRQVAGEGFDLIILENSFMARFLPALPQRVPRLLVMHNVLTLMEQRRAESTCPEERSRADVERTRVFEKGAATGCDLCVVVSEREAEVAKTLLGVEHLLVVPNGVDTRSFEPSPGPGRAGQLLFTGSMNYAPNVRAVQFFCQELLPRIRQELAGVHLHIVGTSPGPEVKDLASEQVTVHGTVPDMRPYYAEAALVVVPLLDGGGTRLKVLEAAACGKAIVSTSLGAEGLAFHTGQDLLLADSPADFSAAVVELLRDDRRREELGRAARLASLRYDWEAIGTEYCRAIASSFPGDGAS